MIKNLKNYTSAVSVGTSMNIIEKALVQAGATDISKNYEGGICIAIRFRIIMSDGKAMFFLLPAKIDACFNVLWKAVKRPQLDTKIKTREQAERTAWKIISDWVQIQLSMIQLNQAEFMQIFLPYAFNPETNRTFFETIKDSGFKQLENKPTQP